MEKAEIDELLDGVERLKGNIKECDDILRVLREIQTNYAFAVAQPKEILEELKTSVQGWKKDSAAVTEGERQLLMTLEDSHRSMQSEIKASAKQILAAGKEQNETFLRESEELLSSVREEYASFRGELRETVQKLLADQEKRCDEFRRQSENCILEAQQLVQEHKEHMLRQEKCLEDVLQAVRRAEKKSFIGMVFSGIASVLALLAVVLVVVL